MKRPSNLGMAVSLGAATLLFGLLGLVSVNSGAVFGISPALLGSSQGLDQAAYDALADNPTSSKLDSAEALTRQALLLSPYENNARLRLAYIDAVRNGRLSAAGVAELKRTYDLIPVDPNVGAWRLRFSLEHWDELTPDTRRAVYDEAMAFGRVQTSEVNVRSILRSIRNPSGSLAAALWLRALDSNPV